MKIMMVTSSLDMGGAETHVVELARALFRMGHEVLTVSAGGRLSPRLEREGIRHVSLPLDRRSPWCLLRSYRGLRRLIKRERPDVIHAHTRPTAWLCAAPARARGIPLVVSAHAHMRAGLRRYVSVWGDRTVAVSEDIRQRLMEAFGVSGERITVIGNGIDTVRFSPGERHEERQRVVFMSRLDGDCSFVADLLCRIAPRLHKAFPRAEILIAGGGERYRTLWRRANRVNEQIGSSVLRVLGGVDRVPALLRD